MYPPKLPKIPQFSLATALYVVTAIGIYLGVDRATAGTDWNDPLGGATLWALGLGGLALKLWSVRRRQEQP
jgi:hypothetical protein